jgi:phosphohistidine phosphatase
MSISPGHGPYQGRVPLTGRLQHPKTCEAETMAGSADRKLVLLRHAKSAWPDMPDHDRPLARRGQRDAPVMGRWLRKSGHVPDQVVCSTAQRARETWQLAQPKLQAQPPVRFDRRVYLASATQLLELIHQAAPATETLLIVGHDPGVPGLALMLAAAIPPTTGDAWAGAARAMAERVQAKFPTAAIAVLEFSGSWDQLGPGSAQLTGFVTPRDLASAQR